MKLTKEKEVDVEKLKSIFVEAMKPLPNDALNDILAEIIWCRYEEVRYKKGSLMFFNADGLQPSPGVKLYVAGSRSPSTPHSTAKRS